MTRNIIVATMEKKLFLATFMIYTLSVERVDAIECFKCSIHPPLSRNEIPRLCSKFNESDTYRTDCPYSNFCMKKTITLPLASKDVVITVRDCAAQKEMKFVETEWVAQIGSEVYQDGCIIRDFDKTKSKPTEVCYCNKPLCNGQQNNQNNQNSDIIAIIMVYNVMKYVKTFQ